MKPKKYLPLLLILFFTSHLIAQDCGNYQKENCKQATPYFTPSDLSRNITISPDAPTEIIIPLRSNEEYFISFCTDKKCRPIHFQIIDMNNPEVIVYDNSTDKFMNEINFENQLARKLKFIVSVSQPKKEAAPATYCVGMHVGYQRMENTETKEN